MCIKSKTALQYNVGLLAQGLAEGEVLKMWTFTLPVVLHPVEAAARWGEMCRELKRSLGFCGVRVFELHPGGHGLHVHVATAGWFDVNEVRAICRRFGWGPVGVVEWEDCGKLGPDDYLAKYLSKDLQVWRGHRLHGVRWWSTFGDLPDKVRVRDVSIESPRRRIWDLVPAWVVCHIMGVDDGSSPKVKVAGQNAHEKRVVAAALASFRDFHSKHGFSWDLKLKSRLSNPMRSFNFAKMWLCNQIYFDRNRFTEVFNGHFERWGARWRVLGWDSEQVREWAFNPAF